MLSATILTLSDLGWNVARFRAWTAPGGKIFNPITAARLGYGELLNAVRHSAEAAAWAMASVREMGGGLQHGVPNLLPARRARKKLIEEHKADTACALDAVTIGAAWGLSQKRTCRCGMEVDPFHFYWSCPMLLDYEDDIVKSTQELTAFFA